MKSSLLAASFFIPLFYYFFSVVVVVRRLGFTKRGRLLFSQEGPKSELEKSLAVEPLLTKPSFGSGKKSPDNKHQILAGILCTGIRFFVRKIKEKSQVMLTGFDQKTAFACSTHNFFRNLLPSRKEDTLHQTDN